MYKSLKTNQVVLLKGSTGSGKTATAFFVAHMMEMAGYHLHLAKNPADLLKFSSTKKTIFLFDDVCGRVSLNRHCADLWEMYQDQIKRLLKHNLNIKLLLTSCNQIDFKKLINCHNPYHLSEYIITLSLKERRRIALKYMSELVSKEINDNTIMMYPFFPLLCTLYDGKGLQNVQKLFTSPTEVIHKELGIMAFKGDFSFLALAFLVICNNRVKIAILKQWSDFFNHTFLSICDELGGQIGSIPPWSIILSGLKQLENIYTSEIDGHFQTMHPKIFDIIADYFGPRMIESILKYGSINFIADRMLLESMNLPQQQNAILIPNNLEDLYLKTMLDSAKKGEYWQCFGNIQSPNISYRNKFMAYLKTNTKRNFPPIDGLHPLYVSSFLGYQDYTQYFIEHNKCLINSPDSIGRTPLYAASRNGFQEIVKALIKSGAFVNTTTYSGWSPLIIATHKGHSEIVRILLRNRANANASKVLSPLFIASQNGFLWIVKCLLECNASVSFENEMGWTALHIACQNGHTDIVEMLIKACCDVNALEHRKWSPLHIACAKGHTNIVNVLLKCRKLMIDQEGEKGRLAIRLAEQCGYSEIVNTRNIQSKIKLFAKKS